jgi:hypothetical protein
MSSGALRSSGLLAAFGTAFEHRVLRFPAVYLLIPAYSGPGEIFAGTFRSRSLNPGGRGRIRTFVARKERQIYSLLVLATHPPVPENLCRDTKIVSAKTARTLTACPLFDCHAVVRERVASKTQIGLVSKDTSPFMLPCRESSRLAPLANIWWSWRRDLNPRPSDYKSDALPAELRQHCSNRTRIAD